MTHTNEPVATDLVERLTGADPDHVRPIDALRLFDSDQATFPLSAEDAEGVLDLVDEAANAVLSLQAEVAEARGTDEHDPHRDDIAGLAITYMCADCAEAEAEYSCHPVEGVVIVGGRVVCKEHADELHKGIPQFKVPDIAKRVKRQRMAAAASQKRAEAAEAEIGELSPEELQLLMHLRDDQQSNVHSVVESDKEKWALGFALSDRGMLAMVSHFRGGTFHITRLGLKAIDAALSRSSK